jgi:AcrR family transcriptional regulator
MAGDRGAEIRGAALSLFAQKGYDATSMRDIAGAVGLLPGSLYAHIRSKESLLLEIIEQGIADFRLAMEPVVAADEPAPERLRTAIRRHMDVIAANVERTGVVFLQWRSLVGEDRQRVVDARRDYEALFVQILQDGVDEGSLAPDLDIGMAVLVILGALNWAPQWLSPQGEDSVEQVADRVTDLFLSGLSAPAPTRSPKAARPAVTRTPRTRRSA